jgi:hypothetical protein
VRAANVDEAKVQRAMLESELVVEIAQSSLRLQVALAPRQADSFGTEIIGHREAPTPQELRRTAALPYRRAADPAVARLPLRAPRFSDARKPKQPRSCQSAVRAKRASSPRAPQRRQNGIC